MAWWIDGWMDEWDVSRAVGMYVCAHEYIYELFRVSFKRKIDQNSVQSQSVMRLVHFQCRPM